MENYPACEGFQPPLKCTGIVIKWIYVDSLQLVAGQLGLKSSRPLSQVGPGSTRPCVFSERSVTYMYPYMYIIYGLGFE